MEAPQPPRFWLYVRQFGMSIPSHSTCGSISVVLGHPSWLCRQSPWLPVVISSQACRKSGFNGKIAKILSPKQSAVTGFRRVLCVNEGGAAPFLCSLLHSTARDCNGFAACGMNYHLHPTVILLSGLSKGSLHAFPHFFPFFGFSLVMHICLGGVTAARSKGCQMKHV